MIQGQCPQCGKHLDSTSCYCIYCGWQKISVPESTYTPIEAGSYYTKIDYQFTPAEVYYYDPSWIQYWTPVVEYN